MFVDKATIEIKAGKGGNGAVAFHREKYVASGGPDGGDGGRGGDVVLVPDPNMSTLMDFRYKRKYAAQNGADGTGKRCSGRDGEDLIIKVPVGTVVRDKATGAVMADMTGLDRFVAAKGGKGGWGNSHFATPTRQAPRFAKAGLPGVEREITLELKLLADVGLVGFPNVGKSTLLSVVSAARPKIANYHFTTLFPNLGVVYVDEGRSFVMADIPGIIEGASEGAGLGHDFLRHIDRCRLLVHVVDVSGCEGRDPIEDFKAINAELKEYSEALASRPMIVAGNKCDVASEEDIERFEAYIKELGLPFFRISAAAHQGVRELVNAVSDSLSTLPPITVFEPDFVEPEVDLGSDEPNIEQDGNYWTIDGGWVDTLVQSTNFGDYESRMHFDRIMRTRGLFDKLEELGVNEGDTVNVCGLEFEYKR
ncbi:MAG: GTPase ObgE [Oscillospiraceae bacterium]|nr:GTPase ObgE [Oscillospiraceae bacterium]